MIAISRKNLVANVDRSGLEIRSAPAGDMIVGWERWPAGDVSGLFRGLPGDACQAEHWGYTVAGKWRVRTAAGVETIEAGQAYYVPRGHVLLEIVEPMEVVEFTRAKDPYLTESVKAFETNLPGVMRALKVAQR
ncbi:MAG TPA: hypothetical protein VM681_06175 [Candidatus Thermoplasmatota archaeon]|nr:hypothetical protein [Candidatus Thermoplasmatota archaeon]